MTLWKTVEELGLQDSIEKDQEVLNQIVELLRSTYQGKSHNFKKKFFIDYFSNIKRTEKALENLCELIKFCKSCLQKLICLKGLLVIKILTNFSRITMKVSKIEYLNNAVPTLDIEVSNVHNYILENGCVVHNSSISCSLTNSIYPARSLSLTKTSGDTSNKWVAPEATRLAKKYEMAFDIDNEHHINNYALWQIFIDQGISADFFLDRSKVVDVSMAKLFKEIAQCAKLGVKTNYYYNTKTDKQDAVDFVNATQASVEDDGVDDSEGGCGSGGCTL